MDASATPAGTTAAKVHSSSQEDYSADERVAIQLMPRDKDACKMFINNLKIAKKNPKLRITPSAAARSLPW